jgi:uncharacterized flavoprotein (TIGR03862 family)
MPASIAIIGAGPAGLMAAETLSRHKEYAITVYDAMPSAGRKFLLAGKGGLNLTHSEPFEQFLTRYGESASWLEPRLEHLTPSMLRDWAEGLGIHTFVGSSGRVFPAEMKAAPLLRAWLHRLRSHGVQFRMRHRWLGWHAPGILNFATETGNIHPQADATILALGGGSWPKLGSDGAWVDTLTEQGIPIAPLRPSNCGFDIRWSEHFRQRQVGQPLKNVQARIHNIEKRGECLLTATGIEDGLIYALSSYIRKEIDQNGSANLHLDLLPDWPLEKIATALAHPRGARSFSSHLQSRLGLKGAKAALLREALPADIFHDTTKLAATIKSLPLHLNAPRPLEEAISSAGGIRLEALDTNLMLNQLPGVFCAGEMLDWDAPTGGYLLTASFATGQAAANGAHTWLNKEIPNTI